MSPKPKASRPHMPDYGIQPENEGQGLMDWAEAERKLVAARNYWISSVSPEGRAHAAPVWGLWHGGRFYFGTGADSQKDRNLKANPSLVLHLESGDDVLIVEGQAAIEGDEELLAELGQHYEAKYEVAALVPPASIYALKPTKAFAWLEASFPGTATRWVFSEG